MAGRPRKQRDNNTFIAKKLDELLCGENFAEFERKNRLPVSTVRRILNGIDPRISTLAMIAKACNVTLDYFFDGDVQGKPPPKVQYGDESERIEILFSLQRNLAEFQMILAEAGRDIAVGQSLKAYRDIPGLLSTIRGLKGLCESIATRLESYPRREKDHVRSDQDRTA